MSIFACSDSAVRLCLMNFMVSTDSDFYLQKISLTVFV